MGKEDDEIFFKAVKKFGNVILPQVIKKKMVLDPETFEMIEKVAPERPLSELQSPVSSEGFIDVEYQVLNPDGVIRKLLLNKTAGDYVSSAFGLVAAANYLGLNPVYRNDGVVVGDRFLPYHYSYESVAGKFLPSYLLNYAGGTSHFDEIGYADVMKEKFPAGFFDNRLVLIGTRAKGTSEDVKFCPFGALSGMEIHANLLYDILNRRFLRRSQVGTSILYLLIFGLLTGYLLWKHSGAWGNMAVIGLVSGWGIFGVILFDFDMVVEIVPIIFMLPVQLALTRLIQQFVTLRQRNYELARKVRELAIVNEVSKAVSFMGSLPKTLDAILSRAVQVLGAKRGSIFMIDDRYEELVERANFFGVEGEVVLDSALMDQFKSGKGIAGEVYSSGKARLVQNVRRDRSFAQKDGDQAVTNSMICVPLLVKQDSIGVMNIVNKNDGRFSEEDLQLAITMANQAAVVIEKARLFNLATIDGLTGLIVPRHFKAKMEEEFRRAKRYGKDLSYLMTDIDHFKKFNDTWGHQVGDLVLREVARVVREAVRDTDIAARYGGEEFAVILPETDFDGGYLFAERLRQKIEEASFEGPKGPLKVTVSIGLSSIPLHPAETAMEMIKLADEALYVAKRNGRNQVGIACSENSEMTGPEEGAPEDSH
jgi:diguanylate cyclase (GGDEF)-like protein